MTCKWKAGTLPHQAYASTAQEPLQEKEGESAVDDVESTVDDVESTVDDVEQEFDPEYDSDSSSDEQECLPEYDLSSDSNEESPNEERLLAEATLVNPGVVTSVGRQTRTPRKFFNV